MKTKARGRFLKQWGSRAGYASFRYGPPTPITLAPVGLKRVYKGDARRHMIDQVVDMLDDWRLSPFEKEAPTYQGLRAAMCLKGHGWTLSDAESSALVAEAIHKLGHARPSHADGQREYTTPRENCSWCWAHLDEEQQARGDRFCSVICARNAMEKRDYADGYDRDAIGRRAYFLVLREKSPERICECCGKAFKTYQRYTRFCSARCANVAKTIYEDRPCECCGAVFHPLTQKQTTCSKACAQKMVSARYREKLPERSCAYCSTIFRPAKTFSMYCSPRCMETVRSVGNVIKANAAGTRHSSVTPRMFDVLWTRHRRTAERHDISPALFDRLFREAA